MEFEDTLKLNNLFDKDNYINGFNKVRSQKLPFGENSDGSLDVDDVSLGEDQIVFASVNNVLGRFLDNDIYNEFLLKNQEDNVDLFPGPAIVKDKNYILRQNNENMKYVYINPDTGETQIVRKKPKSLNDSVQYVPLSADDYTEKTRVNFVERMNGYYIAGTQNGVWYSTTFSRFWKQAKEKSALMRHTVGKNLEKHFKGKNVVAFSLNQGFANTDSILSNYQYFMATGDGQIYGCDSNITWEPISSLVVPPENQIKKMYSDPDTGKLYLLTKGGTYEYYGRKNEKLRFAYGMEKLQSNDFTKLDDDEQHEKNNKLISTHSGIRQSDSAMCFRDMEVVNFSSAAPDFPGTITKIIEAGENFYVGTTAGLYKKNGSTWTRISNAQVNDLAVCEGKLFVANTNAMFFIDLDDNGKIVNASCFANNYGRKVLHLGVLQNNIVFVSENYKNVVSYCTVASSISSRKSITISSPSTDVAVHINNLYTNGKTVYVITNIGIFPLKEDVISLSEIEFEQVQGGGNYEVIFFKEISGVTYICLKFGDEDYRLFNFNYVKTAYNIDNVENYIRFNEPITGFYTSFSNDSSLVNAKYILVGSKVYSILAREIDFGAIRRDGVPEEIDINDPEYSGLHPLIEAESNIISFTPCFFGSGTENNDGIIYSIDNSNQLRFHTIRFSESANRLVTSSSPEKIYTLPSGVNVKNILCDPNNYNLFAVASNNKLYEFPIGEDLGILARSIQYDEGDTPPPGINPIRYEEKRDSNNTLYLSCYGYGRTNFAAGECDISTSNGLLLDKETYHLKDADGIYNFPNSEYNGAAFVGANKDGELKGFLAVGYIENIGSSAPQNATITAEVKNTDITGINTVDYFAYDTVNTDYYALVLGTNDGIKYIDTNTAEVHKYAGDFNPLIPSSTNILQLSPEKYLGWNTHSIIVYDIVRGLTSEIYSIEGEEIQKVKRQIVRSEDSILVVTNKKAFYIKISDAFDESEDLTNHILSCSEIELTSSIKDFAVYNGNRLTLVDNVPFALGSHVDEENPQYTVTNLSSNIAVENIDLFSLEPYYSDSISDISDIDDFIDSINDSLSGKLDMTPIASSSTDGYEITKQLLSSCVSSIINNDSDLSSNPLTSLNQITNVSFSLYGLSAENGDFVLDPALVENGTAKEICKVTDLEILEKAQGTQRNYYCKISYSSHIYEIDSTTGEIDLGVSVSKNEQENETDPVTYSVEIMALPVKSNQVNKSVFYKIDGQTLTYQSTDPGTLQNITTSTISNPSIYPDDSAGESAEPLTGECSLKYDSDSGEISAIFNTTGILKHETIASSNSTFNKTVILKNTSSIPYIEFIEFDEANLAIKSLSCSPNDLLKYGLENIENFILIDSENKLHIVKEKDEDSSTDNEDEETDQPTIEFTDTIIDSVNGFYDRCFLTNNGRILLNSSVDSTTNKSKFGILKIDESGLPVHKAKADKDYEIVKYVEIDDKHFLLTNDGRIILHKISSGDAQRTVEILGSNTAKSMFTSYYYDLDNDLYEERIYVQKQDSKSVYELDISLTTPVLKSDPEVDYSDIQFSAEDLVDEKITGLYFSKDERKLFVENTGSLDQVKNQRIYGSTTVFELKNSNLRNLFVDGQFPPSGETFKKFAVFQKNNQKLLVIATDKKIYTNIYDFNERIPISNNKYSDISNWKKITLPNSAGNIRDFDFFNNYLYVLTDSMAVRTDISFDSMFEESMPEEKTIDFEVKQVLFCSVSDIAPTEFMAANLQSQDRLLYLRTASTGPYNNLFLHISYTVTNRPEIWNINGSSGHETFGTMSPYNKVYVVSNSYLYEFTGYEFIRSSNSAFNSAFNNQILFDGAGSVVYYTGTDNRIRILGNDTALNPITGLNNICIYSYNLYAGTTHGIYMGVHSKTELMLDNEHKIVNPSRTINDYYAIYANEDTNTVHYTYSEINEDEGTQDLYPILCRIHSTNENLAAYNASTYTAYPSTILEKVGNYFVITNGSYVRLFNQEKEMNNGQYVSELYHKALARLVDGTCLLTGFGKVNGQWYLGYGPYLISFNGFETVDYYRYPFDDLRYLKMHYKRRVNRLLKIDNLNFLVGTQNGVRYFKDGQMNLNFVDRKHPEKTIGTSVQFIEDVSATDSDKEYMVVSGKKFYTNKKLVGGTFNEVLDFENIAEGNPARDILKTENPTCITVFGKNNYLIGTTNGLLLSQLEYELYDEMHVITFAEIYKRIKKVWDAYFEKHLEKDHGPDSIVTKLQNKEDANLENFPQGFVKDLEYLRTSKSIQGYTSDIVDTIEYEDANHYIRAGVQNWVVDHMYAEAPYSWDGYYSKMEDPNDGTLVDLAEIPYICMKWLSGMKDFYIYIPTTMTYYKNSPFGFSHSESATDGSTRLNMMAAGKQKNFLDSSCTRLRVYLDNSHFRLSQIHKIEINGCSLPLKIYKEEEDEDDTNHLGREINNHQIFDSVVLPSVCKTLPRTTSDKLNNVNSITDMFNRICLDFSIYGTDAQSIHLIAE